MVPCSLGVSLRQAPAMGTGPPNTLFASGFRSASVTAEQWGDTLRLGFEILHEVHRGPNGPFPDLFSVWVGCQGVDEG